MASVNGATAAEIDAVEVDGREVEGRDVDASEVDGGVGIGRDVEAGEDDATEMTAGCWYFDKCDAVSPDAGGGGVSQVPRSRMICSTSMAVNLCCHLAISLTMTRLIDFSVSGMRT